MSKDEVYVTWEQLRVFTREIFVRVGMPSEDAEIVADVLVWANLRGIDSHGVLRIPWYVDMVDSGQMNPRPNVRVLKETAATVFIDADRAFGPVVTTFAMKRVMEKAKQVGIGWALIRNVTHQGAMGYYSLMAAREGMAGIALVCSPPNMAPYGARAAGLHNSPISIAVPADRHRPLILDMATSVAAGGKLLLAIDKGVPIPEGWALDRDGNPTTDPEKAVILVPTGGAKGSGLALMFECLSSIMAGNPLLEPVLVEPESKPVSREKRRHRHNQNSIVAAIDIGTFTDLEQYKSHVDTLIDCLKNLPKAEGVGEIFVPGEPEDNCCDERIQSGIPLPGGTIRNLRRVAERFRVQLHA
jgi:LDH2 family malate/lactate/ureidoglycolate dehydrogenase